MQYIHEHQEDIDKFIEITTREITNKVLTKGRATPCLCMLYKSMGRIRPMVLPIPPHIVSSEAGKEFLTDTAIPAIIDISKMSGRTILCIAWVMEAWLWDAPAGENKGAPMTKKLYDETKAKGNKFEALVISFETELCCKPVIFKKTGTHPVNGEVTKNIKLEPFHQNEEIERLEGRFTNLLRSQYKHRNN